MLIVLVFVSMALHSANQLGFLSYLYQQRHQIAFALGLITELPITVCSHEHDFNIGLTVKEHGRTESTIPPVMFLSQEIHLFCTEFERINLNPDRLASSVSRQSAVIDRRYTSPALLIFHPPC